MQPRDQYTIALLYEKNLAEMCALEKYKKQETEMQHQHKEAETEKAK